MSKYLPILFSFIGPYLLKCLIYFAAFRMRHIQITIMSCLIIAGAPFFLSFFAFLPTELMFIVTILAAMGITNYYTDAEFYPTIFYLVLTVEIVFYILNNALFPLFMEMLKPTDISARGISLTKPFYDAHI